MVYFAGHGATFGDTPYVVPVDAEFSSLGQVPYELVTLETLIGELRQAKGVRIAILDACRDNAAERELKRQAVAARGGEVTRGLAPMKNPSGLIIAYATQYGATAADNGGGASPGGLFSWGNSSTRHSPFTAALLNNIVTPDLDVTDMFRKVGREVDTATGGKQRPEISISMYEQYALAPGARPDNPGGGVSTPPAGPAADEIAWNIVKDTKDPDQLRSFIAQYPLSPRRREAEMRLRTMEQVAVVAPPVTPAVPTNGPCSGAVTVSSAARCSPLTAAQERGLKPKDSFRECENCPEMVVVPTGAFTMGSPETEKDRSKDEGPQHVVAIGKPFAVGKLHVTVDQFAAFVTESRYQASTTCYKWASGGSRDGSWRDPGFAQEGSHPVVCVSWDDAKAYVDWLAKKTGRPYRMLSEAEWEYAARGWTSPGAYPRFWFGNDEKDLCQYGNFYDQKAGNSGACNDGFDRTSPAGHYKPNAFGLYDMFGNAWQWTADCYHDSYSGAPADGSVRTTGTCRGGRVVRGGSWNDGPRSLRAADRGGYADSGNYVGFRVARTLTP
jgi:formylglycine-generating enzyme required for sulfatase activity